MKERSPDDPLSNEIDSALDGLNLQEIDLPERGEKGGEKRASKSTWRGSVTGISGKDVIVELGPRAQGVIPLSEFDAPPKVGEVFDFTSHGQDEGLWILSRREAKAHTAWQEVQAGSLVQARVSGQNTGGLELMVGPLKAFMPASQVALSREENLAQFIGQTFDARVMEVDTDKKRLLLSRRAVLEAAREEERAQKLGGLSVGSAVTGRVSRIEPFGAFVELGGGIEGLVHVSNLSRARVEQPGDVVKLGDQVRAVILEIKDGGKRIGLSIKALEPDPWQELGGRVVENQVMSGRIVRVTEFGAFVELFPGVEGLLHVSQMAKERVRKTQDAVKAGQTISVRVLSVDSAKKRISLSRLDERGALLGSDDSVEGSVIDEVIQKTSLSEAKTNLGALFRKALGDQR